MMEETSTLDALRGAADKLQDRVVALGDETRSRVRERAPQVRKALSDGYDDTVDTARSLAKNRTVQGWVAVGVLGLLIGLFMSRR
jgi:hypothetical protein